MSRPTKIEREHYAKLVGWQITAILWEEIDGQALPILLLSGWDRDGNAATATVLMDPEGNGRGISITTCDRIAVGLDAPELNQSACGRVGLAGSVVSGKEIRRQRRVFF